MYSEVIPGDAHDCVPMMLGLIMTENDEPRYEPWVTVPVSVQYGDAVGSEMVTPVTTLGSIMVAGTGG